MQQNSNQSVTRKHIKQHKLIYLICAVFIVILLILIARDKETFHNKITTSPTPPNRTNNRVEGQITLKFKKDVTPKQMQQVLTRYNAKVIRSMPQINWLVIKVPVEQTDTILNTLSNEGLIENIEPVYKVYGTAVPNDPMYGRQYHLKNTGQTVNSVSGNPVDGTPGADINIESAWDVTQGNGIKVALIDSGINLNHEDLQNKVIAMRSFIDGVMTVEDGAGHGTNDAGILAANSNNGIGVAGVCPGCQLIIAKSTDDEAAGSTASLVEGLMWAADQGAQVINMSLGGEEPSDLIQEAVNYANQKGAILVGATGNCADNDFEQNNCSSQNPMFYPAASNGVIAVSATNNTDQRYIKANYGTWVHIAAPGETIFATVPNHEYTQGSTLNYATYSGTSQAAPQVSGVLALLLATGLTKDAAIQRMYATADKITGTGMFWQHGKLNAGSALAQAVPSQIPPQPSTVQPLPTNPPPQTGGNQQPPAGGNPQQPPPPPANQGNNGGQPNPTCIFNSLGGVPCLPSTDTPNPGTQQPNPPQQPDSAGQGSNNGGNNGNNQNFIQILLSLIIAIFSLLFGGDGFRN